MMFISMDFNDKIQKYEQIKCKYINKDNHF